MNRSTRLQTNQLIWLVPAGLLDGFLSYSWGYALRIPFMPEMLGTALAAFYWGPGGAISAALIASLVEAFLIDPSRLAFLPVRLLGALILSYGIHSGWKDKWKSLLILSTGQGMVLGSVSGLIQTIVFQGFSGGPLLDLLNAVGAMAMPTLAAIFTTSILVGIIVAVINNFLAWRIFPGLWPRAWGRGFIGLMGMGLLFLVVLNWPARMPEEPQLPAAFPMPSFSNLPAEDRTPTLIQMHQTAGQFDESFCIDCHEDTLGDSDPPAEFASPHLLHFDSELLNFQCVDCHQVVDISQGTAGGLRKQVSPILCANCHRTITHQFAAVYEENSCEDCHEDWLTQKERNSFTASVINLDAITSDDCAVCHGGLGLFQFARSNK